MKNPRLLPKTATNIERTIRLAERLGIDYFRINFPFAGIDQLTADEFRERVALIKNCWTVDEWYRVWALIGMEFAKESPEFSGSEFSGGRARLKRRKSSSQSSGGKLGGRRGQREFAGAAARATKANSKRPLFRMRQSGRVNATVQKNNSELNSRTILA